MDNARDDKEDDVPKCGTSAAQQFENCTRCDCREWRDAKRDIDETFLLLSDEEADEFLSSLSSSSKNARQSSSPATGGFSSSDDDASAFLLFL